MSSIASLLETTNLQHPIASSIPLWSVSHHVQYPILSPIPSHPASLPGIPALQGPLHPSRTRVLSRTPSLPHPRPGFGGWGSAAPPHSWADASPSRSWVAAAAPAPRPALPSAHPAGPRGRAGGAGEDRSGGVGARGKPCGEAGSRRPAGPAARAEPPASAPTTVPAAARRAPQPPARPPPRRIPAPRNPRRSRTEPRTARPVRPPSPQPTPRVSERTSRSGVGSPAQRHGWVLSGLIPDEKLMGHLAAVHGLMGWRRWRGWGRGPEVLWQPCSPAWQLLLELAAGPSHCLHLVVSVFQNGTDPPLSGDNLSHRTWG